MKILGKFDLQSYDLSLRKLHFKHSQHFDIVDATEIKFLNTFYLEIPNYIEDCDIYVGDEDDMKHVQSRNPDLNIIWKMQKVFVLNSFGVKYYVGASKVTIIKKDSSEEYTVT
ncbi:MAG: hypothetical protein HWE22_19765 [Flavobacteriales bacterium]|nr:hypothetical protein [Flavobacteriales bacterium]